MDTQFWKAIAFRLLTFQPFNFIFSRLIRLFKVDIPFIFPVVGQLLIKVYDDLSFYMLTDGGDSIASRMYLYGSNSFEPESLEIFTKLVALSSVEIVFDVGANTGIYSLAASSKDANAQVFSFEPMPDIFRRLTGNIECNSFSNVYAKDIALSDQNGHVNFYYIPAITVPTGGSAAKKDWPGVQEILVKCSSIDSFCSSQNIDQIDLIKLDTEMTEPAVLRGGAEVITRCKPFIICEVLDEGSSNDLTKFLQPLGYLFFHINSSGLIEKEVISHDPSYKFANYLFVHTDRCKEIEGFIEGR